MNIGNFSTLASGAGISAVGALGSAVGGVAALETLVLINKHAFLPMMEYTTKTLYGALGQDPL